MKSDKTEETPADIETASDGYAARFAGRIGSWMLKKQADIVRQLLRDHKSDKILDVGGGHAQLARPLADAGFQITVHGSASSCAGRIQDLRQSGRCEFIESSMFAIPVADREYPTVVCIRLITHCDEWQNLIGELCRVAGKRIIIDYPSARSLNALVSGKIFAFKKKLEGNTRTWRLFSHRELSDEFAKHGFSCTCDKKQFFLPMVLHRTLRRPAISALLEGICRILGLTRLLGSPVIMLLERRTP